MQRNIFWRTAALLTFLIVFFGMVLTVYLARENRKDIQNTYTVLLSSASIALDDGERSDMQSFCRELARLNAEARYTCVDAGGTVLGDSAKSPEGMDNHADRPEIRQAFREGTGYAVRFSEAIGIRMVYVAVRVQDDLVLRAAVPLADVADYLQKVLLMMTAGILVSLFLAFLLARSSAKAAVKPVVELCGRLNDINDGKYDKKLSGDVSRELLPIVNSINDLTASAEKNMQQVRSEKNKLELLLNSMQQGIIVADSQENLYQINDSARRIFCPEKSENPTGSIAQILRDEKLLAAVRNCLSDGACTVMDCTFGSDGSIWSAEISPLNTPWMTNGALVIISDVTALRQEEKMQTEFLSNAGHELKTPVTSIKGFAEILDSGMVSSEEKTHDYLGRIRKEADRLGAIVDDILKLNSYEERQISIPAQDTDLYEIAGEILQSLAPMAQEKQVTMKRTGGSARIFANRDDMHRLIQNLLENAVKYNVPGGSAEICVKQQKNAVTVRVQDTGIGIEEKHLSRIFERFYRVDKGRSRSVGGTGLGLSIVRSIATAYHADIHAESKPGKGTVITVTFPAEKP